MKEAGFDRYKKFKNFSFLLLAKNKLLCHRFKNKGIPFFLWVKTFVFPFLIKIKYSGPFSKS